MSEVFENVAGNRPAWSIGRSLIRTGLESAACASLLFASCAAGADEAAVERSWQEGWLHIHHISTGRGDSAFAILPDGTTLLIDAGDLDPVAVQTLAPLVPALPRPSQEHTAAEVIANHIRKLGFDAIDYAVITHFDSDHYGHIVDGPDGPRLSGVAELDELVPFSTLIDRAWPGYDFPGDLVRLHSEKRPAFLHYKSFVDDRARAGREVLGLRAGISSQIVLRHKPDSFPTFEVRNIKVNNLVWSGRDELVHELFSAEDMFESGLYGQENPLSIAMVVRYGDFEYFTGGDLTGDPGFNKPGWFDVETPVAEVVGEVDVTTLNHHGNRSSVNANFLRALQPRILIQQSWISDHPGSEVVHRMADRALYPGDRDVFATYVHPASLQTIGRRMAALYESYSGHIVVRVAPGGSLYFVDVLDDTRTTAILHKTHGPYESRNQAN